MLPRTTSTLAVFAVIFAGLVGCAAPDGEGGAPGPGATEEADLTKQLSDDALKGKLRGILTDVSFTSESDYGYVVLEGEKVSGSRLSTKVVREKLKAAVMAASSSKRDISRADCRAVRLDVSSAIADGDKAEVPTDKEDESYVYARHDKQVAIALKTMRSQLKGVVGFTFGTNASGDQDDQGTVHYVYVGISKTSGKLIAIMTEAVYT
jgi:hypothetical protein